MLPRLVDIGGIVDHHCLRKVGRYQRYNQKPYIEEQTIQGLIGQTMIYKTLHRKDWATRIQLKTEGELR